MRLYGVGIKFSNENAFDMDLNFKKYCESTTKNILNQSESIVMASLCERGCMFYCILLLLLVL